jgi:hypothetical protein
LSDWPWRAFQSRHLNGGKYDAESQILTVQFVNGALHEYYGVPEYVADTLFQASSAGTYFHAKIRGQYQERQTAAGVTSTGRRSKRRY